MLRSIASSCSFLVVFAVAAQGQLEFVEGSVKTSLKQAKKERKSVVLDFYADWCLPCKQMEKTSFVDPTLVQRFTQEFIMHRVDVEMFVGMDVAEEYGVTQYPTILFLDKKGKEISRLVGFQSAKTLLQQADQLKNPAKKKG